TCAARTRALLAARAGVRHAPEHPTTRLLGTALLLSALLATGLVRLMSPPAQASIPQQGAWEVLGPAEYISPVGLTADSQGNLYLVDAAYHHVYKIAPDGTRLASFGVRGNGPGQFERPSAIALDDLGDIYVADTANSRIQK